MAGLGRDKKRSNSSTSRVSRFSEALGAAQESSQESGYPKTQSSKKSATQKSKTVKESSETSGYPATQAPTQQQTQSSKKSATQKSKTVKESSETSGYSEIQPSEQQETQSSKKSATQKSKTVKENSETSGYPATQSSEQQETQKLTTAKKTLDKLAKRENPDYTQTTFRIPKKLSRQINRTLMDLADEGVEMDRSDLLEALTGGFIRLVNEVGAVEALEKFIHLGTQVDE